MKKTITLIAVLFFPALVYVYFALGIPKVMKAPIYGPRSTIETTDAVTGEKKIDTVYSTIPAFRCLTSGGLLFDSKKLDGRLYVAVFVPRDSAVTLLHLLEEDVRLKKNTYAYARFVFFMVGDSAGNVPMNAPDMAKDMHLGTDTAFTVFMRQGQWDSLRLEHYFIHDPALKKDPWETTTDAVLIDRLGRIRGYYNLRMYPQIKEMKEDVNHILLRDEGVQTLEESKVEQKHDNQ